MKKIIVTSDIIISILAIGIIYVDLHFLAIPKWLSLIFMLVLSAIIVWEWIKGKHLWGKVLFSVINIVVIIIVFAGTYCNPYRNSISMYANPNYYCEEYGTNLTYGEAKADLDQAMKNLKNVHPMFIHGLTDEVKELYDQALSNLKEDESISINDLSKEIEMIFSSLGDAHTHAGAYYPEYHYLKYIYGHELAGDELLAVNGYSIEEIFDDNRNAFSYETKEYGIRHMTSYLQSIEDLGYLGFDIDGGITYTYMDNEGKVFDETYYAEDFLTREEYWEYNDPDNSRNNESDDEYEFVKYEIMESKNLAVLTLYSCEYNDEYKQCLADMFREVKEKGIDNVCVDLRANGGGNSLVADEFIHYLNVDSYRTWGQDWRLGIFIIPSEGSIQINQQYTDLLFDGDVYVLTSTNSFSSAMDFAMLISDNKLGKIIGEPAGNKPRGYGDVSVFKLKNSGLIMQVSTKKWYRVDESNTDELIEPDIACSSEEALKVLEERLCGTTLNESETNDAVTVEQLIGLWYLAEGENDDNVVNETFPGAMEFGNSMEITSDGNISWYIGADGGSGTYQLNGNVLTANMTNDIDGTAMTMEFTVSEKNGQPMLVMEYKGLTLCWSWGETETGKGV